MLYVLHHPSTGHFALLRLADLDQWTTRQRRMAPLVRDEAGGRDRARTQLGGVPLADIEVLGACGQCGAVYEYEAAERLVEGERVASDYLAPPPAQDVRAMSGWFAAPADWLARLQREDVGLFPTPRPLTELRDKGHLPRPRFPSDNKAAYDRAVALCVAGAV